MPKQRCECGATYRLPESAVGKKARCKRCGIIFRVEPEPPKEPDDSGIFRIMDDPTPAADALPINTRMATLPGSTPDIDSEAIKEIRSSRSYTGDLFATLMFPSKIGNLVVFLFLWPVVWVAEVVLGYAPGIGLIGQIIIMGWYCAYRFETLVEAASGNEDLPTLTPSGGALEGIIQPLLKWIGSWLVALIPTAVLLSIAQGTGMLASGWNVGSLLQGLGGMADTLQGMLLLGAIALPLFCWPIIVLCVAIGGFDTLTRPDLIVITLVKTFPIYMITVLILAGTEFAVLNAGPPMGIKSMFASIGVVGAAVYADIVVMRVIGHYYHHHKDRFAWDWG